MSATPSFAAALDAAEAAETGTTAPADPGTETPTTPAAPEATPAEPEGVERPGEEGKWFPEKVVTDLRQENANRRVQLREYEEAFGAYSPEDRQFFIDMAKGLLGSPDQQRETAGILKQVAEGVLGGTPEQQQQAQQMLDDAAQPGLTAADVQKMVTDALTAHDAKAQQDAAEAQIQSEAKALGYDPDGPEYLAVLKLALTQTGGDMQKAHEAWQQMIQSKIDGFVEGKRNQAQTPTPPEGGAAAGDDKPIKNLKDARAAAEALLDAAL